MHVVDRQQRHTPINITGDIFFFRLMGKRVRNGVCYRRRRNIRARVRELCIYIIWVRS